MKKLIIPILLFFVFFGVSCGDASSDSADTKSKKENKNSSTQLVTEKKTKDDNVVDPEEFSKAFSETITTEKKNDSKEFTEDKSKFFKKGNIVKNQFTNQEFQQFQIAPGTLASKIFSNKKFSWLPNWDYSEIGGVNLPDAVLSKDLSLLCILDNVTSGKVFKSSLIVSINTFNFNIQSIHYFKGKLFKGIRFVYGTTKVIVWEELQGEKGKGKGLFHLIDLRNGHILQSSKLVKSQAVNFEISFDGKLLFVKSLIKNNKIFVFKIDELDKFPEVVKCDQGEGIIKISDDNSIFAMAGASKIEIFKIVDKMKLKEMNNPLDKVPDDFIFVDGKNNFALLSYMKPFYLIVDGDPKKICDFSGRKLFFRRDNKSVLFEESKNKTVSILDIKSLKNLDSFSPEKLRPKTYGFALVLAYLPQLKKYMVLDQKGNLSLFDRPGRRWRKIVIFTPGK